MDLLFDTYTNERGADVSRRTKELAQALLIDSDLHAPPPVLFVWGSFSFQAVVERLTQKFTMFLANGTPVRATLSVTFKQYQPIQQQLQNPRRTSADKSTRHELSIDESIWGLAAAKYGEPLLAPDRPAQSDSQPASGACRHRPGPPACGRERC